MKLIPHSSSLGRHCNDYSQSRRVILCNRGAFVGKSTLQRWISSLSLTCGGEGGLCGSLYFSFTQDVKIWSKTENWFKNFYSIKHNEGYALPQLGYALRYLEQVKRHASLLKFFVLFLDFKPLTHIDNKIMPISGPVRVVYSNKMLYIMQVSNVKNEISRYIYLTTRTFE